VSCTITGSNLGVIDFTVVFHTPGKLLFGATSRAKPHNLKGPKNLTRCTSLVFFEFVEVRASSLGEE